MKARSPSLSWFSFCTSSPLSTKYQSAILNAITWAKAVLPVGDIYNSELSFSVFCLLGPVHRMSRICLSNMLSKATLRTTHVRIKEEGDGKQIILEYRQISTCGTDIPKLEVPVA